MRFLSLSLAAIIVLTVTTVHAETLTGHPRVVDADTLTFGTERVRVEGIDAPETNQHCLDSAGQEYPCGKVATEALKTRIGTDEVRCEGTEKDQYGRLIGWCYFADESDLNDWVVRQGHALAYRKYSEKYIGAEEEAEQARRGIWAGTFVPPWDWRKGKR